MALIGTISGSNGTSNTAVSGTLAIANRAGALFPVTPTDAVLFVSGAIGTGTDRSVFGGDVFVSGSFVAPAKFPQGLSGSLTKLTDGTNYIIAGTNIDTSTGSNGAITISVTGITPGMTSLTGDVTGTGPGATATTISTTGINRTNNLGLTTLTSTAPTATQLRDIPAFRCAGTYTPAYFDLVAPTDSPEGRQVTFVNATGAPLTIRNIGAASVRTMSSFGGSIWVYSTASVNWFCTSNV